MVGTGSRDLFFQSEFDTLFMESFSFRVVFP